MCMLWVLVNLNFTLITFPLSEKNEIQQQQQSQTGIENRTLKEFMPFCDGLWCIVLCIALFNSVLISDNDFNLIE